ncbi:GTP-binding protein [Synechococcus sp. CBW1006]|uniref:GTP-binding protein n=1 Tax=Synechococcus sp. CBW1006 TaxID=1353138 RepID=UPI0018CD32F3|nr:GTP-binding protein [Synechococcus sp. CBW1006]QPN65612.1 GTP-binding protein [Synechococcus sp. CBW1006]
MSQTLLLSGPPGCGKTSWILNQIQSHSGPSGYLRLAGYPDEGLAQARDGGIDRAFLLDQCPELLDLSDLDQALAPHPAGLLALIELPQFHPPAQAGLAGVDRRVMPQLQALHLTPDRHLHFGRDPELPQQDTLDFSHLQVWSLNLNAAVWDPASLSSFWFELVNGAYGDVYRAKALMNLPDGRAFFCNWMVSQEGSQFLPLQTIALPNGRPDRLSRLVVQGKDLDPAAIEATVANCLLSDAVLEQQQVPLRQRYTQPTRSA